MRLVSVVVLMLASLAYANPRGGSRQTMFPMQAGDFKKLVEARFVMFKARLEDNMKTHKVSDAKRDTARKQATTLQADVMKKVDLVGADKTVTQPEAMQVRQLDRQGRLAIWKELGIAPPRRPARDDD
jgi:hypothetical protein